MKSLRKKFIAFFAVLTIFMMVSGFCFAGEVSADVGEMLIAPVDAMHYMPDTVLIHEDKPMHDDISKLCCLDGNENVPVTPVFSLNENVKLLTINSAAELATAVLASARYANIAVAEVSPPKPDKLSSVLRLE